MRNTPSLFLLLLLLAGGPRGWPYPALAHQCPADLTISDPEGVASIFSRPLDEDSRYISIFLYVQPEPGFQGVSLVVEEPAGGDGGGGEVHTAWFPLNATCFQGPYEYWQIKVMARLFSYDDFEVEVRGGECRKVCTQTTTITKHPKFSVVGHGPSAWKLNIPNVLCNTTVKSPTKKRRNSPISCSSHSSKSTPTLPVTPTPPVLKARRICNAESRPTYTEFVVVVVIAVVIVVVTIVAVVRAVLWQRRRQE